jgi:hypothetical protein
MALNGNYCEVVQRPVLKHIFKIYLVVQHGCEPDSFFELEQARDCRTSQVRVDEATLCPLLAIRRVPSLS